MLVLCGGINNCNAYENFQEFTVISPPRILSLFPLILVIFIAHRISLDALFRCYAFKTRNSNTLDINMLLIPFLIKIYILVTIKHTQHTVGHTVV
jgi:hypothetical protein